MNDLDLDHRLRALRPATSTTGDVGRADLHRRAAGLRQRAGDRRLRRRRRTTIATATIAVVGVIGLAVGLAARPEPDLRVSGSDRAEPSATTVPTTTTAPPTARPLGDSTGLSLTVAPRTDLVDGQLVDVAIEGLDTLDNPLLVQCAGDVTIQTASSRCDLRGLEGADLPRPGEADVSRTVTVRRVIAVSGSDSQSTAYDCAVEPTGCVVAVGQSSIPTRGLAVPVTFDATAPVATPTLGLDRPTGLVDGSTVAATAHDLRPNSTYSIVQCTVDDPWICDETALWPSARTDTAGTLTTSLTIRAAIYGSGGAADCTAVPCELRLGDSPYEPVLATPIAFAADVEPPRPTLSVFPAGPYRDDQVVTVRGTGFPPGLDIGGQLGQCPDGKDTAVEERCQYPALGSGPVGADGTFSADVRLSDSLLYTGRCSGSTGCHLGWVLTNGPTVVTAPLDFGPAS